jgi:hypothetical protein
MRVEGDIPCVRERHIVLCRVEEQLERSGPRGVACTEQNVVARKGLNDVAAVDVVVARNEQVGRRKT